jgi:protein SCO1/2
MQRPSKPSRNNVRPVTTRLAPRVRLALSVCVGALVGVLAVLVLTGGPGRPAPLGLVEGFAGAQLPPSLPADDFALRDQDGRLVRLRDYAGKVVILTFLYSTCQDTCPLIAQQIRGALDQLGRPVPALAVSVDPVGDSPLNAQRFLVRQSVAGRLDFLLGTRGQLAPIWRAYGIQPLTAGQPSGSEHSVDVVLLDKAGRPRIGYQSAELSPEPLVHDIVRLEAEPVAAHPPPRVVL